jgi:16S rRNA (cytidine1402-2'-O)-methyltransferase
MAAASKPGTLYVVATPIGNLEDMTYRAVRTLREANLVACEDTRQTRKLLDHYEIQTPTISYHDHNEAERALELLAKLQAGQTIAQVSDAGMPGIADPGYRLVKLAIENNIPVVPVPGASAVITALAAAGLATDAFEFQGFLPAKSGQRRTVLEQFRDSQHAVVVYETPHRIREALEDVVAILGPARPLVIARELTKLHEEFLRGTAAELLERVQKSDLRGEITLLIAKSEGQAAPALSDLPGRLQEIMRAQKLDEKAALKVLAKEMGLPKSEAYRELQRQSVPRSTSKSNGAASSPNVAPAAHVGEKITPAEKAIQQELDALIYSVSHDLRSPLRAIDGFSQALLQDSASQLDEQGLDDLKKVRTATARLQAMLDDLLSLSRLARSPMEIKTVDLALLAEKVMEQLRRDDPGRQVSFKAPAQLMVQGDESLLRTALQHLLDNAWKFTRSRLAAAIDLGQAVQGGTHAFFVRDNGVGFPMKYADRLFSPFQRLHGPDEYPGTGMGLATVQRIVRRHGGTVWFEAEEDRGATFYFTLGSTSV